MYKHNEVNSRLSQFGEKKTAREDHETLEYTDIYVTVFYCTSSKKILPKFREKFYLIFHGDLF